MKSRSAFVLAPLAAGLLMGCAQNGILTTGSLNPSAVDEQQAKEAEATKVACATLAANIEGLNKDGIADKVAKAAAKKYKMKTADLAKANELNQANAEFQAKCTNYPMATVAETPPAEPAEVKDAKAAKPATAPPVPPRKTAAQAAAPKQASAQTAAAEPAKAAPAEKAKTETVASAEPETKQASAETQTSAVNKGPFAAPRLSVAPSTVTTTGNP